MKKMILMTWFLGCCALANAQDLLIKNAWARFSVPGMKASGVFLDLDNQSRQDDVLLSVSTPVAGQGEIHESISENGMMKMQALPEGLPLPASQVTHLQPGSYHVMLMNLKEPLKLGMTIPVTFKFKYHKPIIINVPVIKGKSQNSAASAPDHHMMRHE